jgi:7,8-dihydropterin-6-yl-methyl-4-(beta-D-ribofuranosyl)aminobenzene 5'-phosphate synthase
MNKIICVVDNSACEGKRLMTEHGLSFWIATENGNALFDTGQSPQALAHNMKELGLKAEDIDALALSHAHFDHTGGLDAVLPAHGNLPVYANPDIFRLKYSLHDGNYDASGFEKGREDYEARADWRLNGAPTEIFPTLWTTGVITQRDFPEGRSAGHYIRKSGKFVQDPYRDDMSLVLKTEAGLVLICGCCHAGILNTLAHVRAHFEGPIIAVLGGIHLMPAEKPMVEEVIDTLENEHAGARYYLNHCTGDDALKAFKTRFGENAQHFKAGDTATF